MQTTGTWTWYGKGLYHYLNGDISFVSDTIKVLMTTTGYTPSKANDETYAGISSYETTGTGYTSGGITLSGKSLSYTSGSNTTHLIADDITIGSSTIGPVNCIVMYKSTGVGSTSYLLGYGPFASSVSSESGDFILDFSSLGTLSIVA